MPTYEYRCRKCGEVFEHFEHMTEHGQVKPVCPKCQSKDVEAQLSSFYAKTSRKS